jgi:type III secretion protein V
LLTDVLRKLLQEQVSVRNLRGLLEALVAPATEGDAAQLAERCRLALARQISHQYANGGPLFAWLVDPAVEETLRAGGQGLDPKDAGAILEGVKRVARPPQQAHAQGGRAPATVLLASADVRRVLRRLVEGAFPDVAVLTFNELDPELQVRPVGRLVAVS